MDIKAVLFDIDGVVTDGKMYFGSNGEELKSYGFKDMDAITSMLNDGIIVGCISGENTAFSKMIADRLPFGRIGCKDKLHAIDEFQAQYPHVRTENICYIGDGKYDVAPLGHVGLAICPADAIAEVRQTADIVLKSSGGNNCIDEVRMILTRLGAEKKKNTLHNKNYTSLILNDIRSHIETAQNIIRNEELLGRIGEVADIVVKAYQNGGQLFLCGNGGSAADAQHIAAEMVGRFYLERKAYCAEALTTNTSILTCLGNDYSYDIIFARQLEAKSKQGDVLIGISTSGESADVMEAFQYAQNNGIITVLMTGNISPYKPIVQYADYLLDVPSSDTPRTQEIHIMMGHIICEIIERELAYKNTI